jgi:hypothetical protein
VQQLSRIVERVFETETDESVLCLCCQFVLKSRITDPGKNSSLSILGLKNVLAPKVACDRFDCFWETDSAFAVGVALHFLDELHDPRARALALMLWETRDAVQFEKLEEGLCARYPFLLIEKRSEEAAQWFVQHPVSQWPVQCSS